MSILQRIVPVRLVLLLIIWLFVFSWPLHAMPEAVKEKARVAMDAGTAGRHEEAYQIWTELLATGASSLGEDGYSFARSNIYHEVFKILERYGDDDCRQALAWTEKGKKPGPPSYTAPYDYCYPLLVMMEGVCLARLEKYEDAYRSLMLSKDELQKLPSNESIAEFLRQAEHYLTAVRSHILSQGDYVTNKGIVQMWIGKVVNRSPDSLSVHITYANEGLHSRYAKGQTAEFPVADCKELGAISADAALKGWRE